MSFHTKDTSIYSPAFIGWADILIMDPTIFFIIISGPEKGLLRLVHIYTWDHIHLAWILLKKQLNLLSQLVTSNPTLREVSQSSFYD